MTEWKEKISEKYPWYERKYFRKRIKRMRGSKIKREIVRESEREKEVTEKDGRIERLF